MLEYISRRIVKWRVLIIVFFLAATVFSAIMIPKAKINYDFTDYLSEDTVTKKSLTIMEREFGSIDQLTVMFASLPEGEAEKITEALKAREGILRATHDESADTRTVDGTVYERIQLILDCEDSVAYVKELETYFSSLESVKSFDMSGAAPQTLFIQKNLLREIPIAMILAISIVIAVLFITSHSYFEPLLFLIVLLVSVVLNMGTNWVFDSISFITFAVSAILQLALAMDYSIMLLHSYFDILEETSDKNEAMAKALARSFMPISASSLTTIAGLASLMFMSFTIGYDLGVVLCKGIVFSLLTVFLFMPALIILFSKPLERLKHKPISLGGARIGGFVLRFKRAIALILVCAVGICAFVQTRNEYLFTDPDAGADKGSVADVFGVTNQLVILFPTGTEDADFDRQRELIKKLENVTCAGKPAVTGVTSIVTTGEAAISYYTISDISEMTGISPIGLGLYLGGMGFGTVVRGDVLVDKAYDVMPKNEMISEIKETLDFARGMFIGEEYSRMILTVDMPNFGEETYRTLDEISALLNDIYPDATVGIAGTCMSSYDISSAFTGDMMRVNLITVFAILLILLLSFRSACVPVILICVIQGAIWITMAISRLKGEGIFFMSYLICTAIQMGATIDYGILFTSSYRRMRKSLSPRDAVISALTMSLPTVFTSGVILIFAGFAIGNVSTVFYISSIGSLIARGTLISVLMVLALLPSLLIILDKAVMYGVREVYHEPECK